MPSGPAAARSRRPSLSASKAITAVKRFPAGSPAKAQAAKRPPQVVPEGEAVRAGGDQVRQAVVVQIRAGEGLDRAGRGEAAGGGAVREAPLAQVVEPGDPLGVGDQEVEVAVAVEIARHQSRWIPVEESARKGLLPHRLQGSLEGVAEELHAPDHPGRGRDPPRCRSRARRRLRPRPAARPAPAVASSKRAVPAAAPEGDALRPEADEIELARRCRGRRRAGRRSRRPPDPDGSPPGAASGSPGGASRRPGRRGRGPACRRRRSRPRPGLCPASRRGPGPRPGSAPARARPRSAGGGSVANRSTGSPRMPRRQLLAGSRW